MTNADSMSQRDSSKNTGRSDSIVGDAVTDSRSPSRQLDLNAALLRLAGDKDLFQEFVEIFFEDAPELLEQIEIGISDSDSTTVERNAHSYKGLVSNFGAQGIVRTALDIERSAREDDLSTIPKSFKDLKRLHQNLCDELRRFRPD